MSFRRERGVRSVIVAFIAVVALALGFPGRAAADDDQFQLKFYGVVDESVCYASNFFGQIDPNFFTGINPGVGLSRKNATKSVLGICNNALSDSRFGLKGTAQLDGDLKAIFALETGFNVSTGMANNANLATTFNGGATPNSSLSGQFLNRQSYLGFASESYGTLTVGRTYNFITDVLSVYDPVQFADLFSPLSFSGGLGGGAGVSEATRIENNIKYTKKFEAFNIGVNYKLGGFAGGESIGGGYGINLGYETEGWGIQMMAEQMRDVIKVGAGGDPFTTANYFKNNANAWVQAGTALDTVDYIVAVKAKVMDGTLKFGWEQYQNSPPSNPDTDSQINNLYGYPISVTPMAANAATQVVNIYFAGYGCNASEKLNLSFGWYLVNYDQGFASAASGGMNYYSFLADYSLSKYVDTYFGLMNTVSGVTNNTHNLNTSVGARFKF